MNEVPIQRIETAADLYYAAEKYDIEDICQIALQYMMNRCDNGNIHYLLTKSLLFELPELEAATKIVFSRETYSALSLWIAHSVTISDNIFAEFIALDKLCICDEFDLYFALETLVDLGRLPQCFTSISQIRFLTMNTRNILNCDMLSDTEKCAVIAKVEALKDQEPSLVEVPAQLSTKITAREMMPIE